MRLSVEKINDIIALRGVWLPFMGAAENSHFEFMTEPKPQKKKSPLPKFFEKDPELKAKVEAYLAGVPQAEKERTLHTFLKFMNGEVTWAEIKGISNSLLKELAKIAYLKLRRGDYHKAEVMFKGLAVIDHNNWYYRAALGAVYHKQKLYDEAIEEYTIALELNDQEITSWANRGECHYVLKNYEDALHDFEHALKLDSDGKNAWAKRARVLKQKLLNEGHGSTF